MSLLRVVDFEWMKIVGNSARIYRIVLGTHCVEQAIERAFFYKTDVADQDLAVLGRLWSPERVTVSETNKLLCEDSPRSEIRHCSENGFTE